MSRTNRLYHPEYGEQSLSRPALHSYSRSKRTADVKGTYQFCPNGPFVRWTHVRVDKSDLSSVHDYPLFDGFYVEKPAVNCRGRSKGKRKIARNTPAFRHVDFFGLRKRYYEKRFSYEWDNFIARISKMLPERRLFSVLLRFRPLESIKLYFRLVNVYDIRISTFTLRRRQSDSFCSFSKLSQRSWKRDFEHWYEIILPIDHNELCMTSTEMFSNIIIWRIRFNITST